VAAQLVASIRDLCRARESRDALNAVLPIPACTAVTGARFYVTMQEWATAFGEALLSHLDLGSTVPCESTVRRTLQTVDAPALEATVAGWDRTSGSSWSNALATWKLASAVRSPPLPPSSPTCTSKADSHTQRSHVQALYAVCSHYPLTVKGNQPDLLARCKALNCCDAR